MSVSTADPLVVGAQHRGCRYLPSSLPGVRGWMHPPNFAACSLLHGARSRVSLAVTPLHYGASRRVQRNDASPASGRA